MRKAQTSVEYIFTVGFSLIALVAATSFFLGSTNDSSDENLLNQATHIGRTMVDTSESIFYVGSGSKTTLTLDIPKGVENITIWDKRDLVITISTHFGVSELVFVSSVDLAPLVGGGEGVHLLPLLDESGRKNIEVNSVGDNVTIGQV